MDVWMDGWTDGWTKAHLKHPNQVKAAFVNVHTGDSNFKILSVQRLGSVNQRRAAKGCFEPDVMRM